jgi:hypothetical protein
MRYAIYSVAFFTVLLLLSACSDDAGDDYLFLAEDPSCDDSHSPTISFGRTTEAGEYYHIYINSWDDCCIRKIEVSIEKFGRNLYSNNYDFLTCQTRADDAYIPFMKKYLLSNINTTVRAIVTDSSGKSAELSCIVLSAKGGISLDC